MTLRLKSTSALVTVCCLAGGAALGQTTNCNAPSSFVGSNQGPYAGAVILYGVVEDQQDTRLTLKTLGGALVSVSAAEAAAAQRSRPLARGMPVVVFARRGAGGTLIAISVARAKAPSAEWGSDCALQAFP